MKHILKLFLIPFLGITLMACEKNEPTYATRIMIEAKEDVEILLNKNDEILSSTSSISTKDTTIETYVNNVIAKMIENKGIVEDENSVLISIDSKNDKTDDRLEDRLEQSLLTQTFPYSLRIYVQDIDASLLSKKYDISAGKAQLVEEILDESKTYTVDDLKNMSTHALMDLYFKVEDASYLSTPLNTTSYISKEEALNIALNHANIHKKDASRIRVELDKEYNKMIYEVQFDYNFKEYEYDIDASSKEIVFYEID